MSINAPIVVNMNRFFQRYCDAKDIRGLSIMLSGMTIGILIGEGVTSVERLSIVTAQLVTIFAAVIGVRACWISIIDRNWLVLAAIAAILVANIGFAFVNMNEHTNNIIYDLATLFSVLVINKYSELYHLGFKEVCKRKVGRRATDKYFCIMCNQELPKDTNVIENTDQLKHAK